MSKHRRAFAIVFATVALLGATLNGYEYFFEGRKTRDLVGVIVFGLLAVFKIGDIIEYSRNQNSSQREMTGNN